MWAVDAVAIAIRRPLGGLAQVVLVSRRPVLPSRQAAASGAGPHVAGCRGAVSLVSGPGGLGGLAARRTRACCPGGASRARNFRHEDRISARVLGSVLTSHDTGFCQARRDSGWGQPDAIRGS